MSVLKVACVESVNTCYFVGLACRFLALDASYLICFMCLQGGLLEARLELALRAAKKSPPRHRCFTLESVPEG